MQKHDNANVAHCFSCCHAARQAQTLAAPCALIVPHDSSRAHNITVGEEAAHFCWSKDWGSAMENTVTMALDSVESLHLKDGDALTAGGASVHITARLKGGFCQSSCCCDA